MDFAWVFSAFDNPQSLSPAGDSTHSLSSNRGHYDLHVFDLATKRAEYYSEGNWPKALELCSEIIGRGNIELGDYIVRANTLIKMNDFSVAIEDCNAALKLNPCSSAAFCTRALAYRFLGRFDEAEADYIKAQELNPDDTVIYSNRSAIYRSRFQWRKVIEDCT